MKRAILVLWPLVPCLLVSALVHLMDDDVGGVAALVSSPSLRLSVLIWAFPPAACGYLAFGAYLKGGLIGYLAVALPASSILGCLLALGGSTATTTSGFLWSVMGSASLFLVVLSLASLPGGAVARRLRDARNSGQPLA